MFKNLKIRQVSKTAKHAHSVPAFKCFKMADDEKDFATYLSLSQGCSYNYSNFDNRLSYTFDVSSSPLVCLCIVFSEIGGHFLQDILTHLASSCANVRYWWDRNWARIFSFVKTAQCLISLRFWLRYRCFFREEISKMTFFSPPWSWENAFQRQCMVVNRKEQLMKLYENLSARPRSSRCKMRLSKPVCK